MVFLKQSHKYFWDCLQRATAHYNPNKKEFGQIFGYQDACTYLTYKVLLVNQTGRSLYTKRPSKRFTPCVTVSVRISGPSPGTPGPHHDPLSLSSATSLHHIFSNQIKQKQCFCVWARMRDFHTEAGAKSPGSASGNSPF